MTNANIKNPVSLNNHLIMRIGDTIKSLKGYTSARPILEGYSTDRKYLVEKGVNKYLLRTFHPSEYSRKSEEFTALKLMIDQGVKCSVPIEIGLMEHEELGYMLLSFIEGNNAEAALSHMNRNAQYDLGVEAGLELRKMNECEAPNGVREWSVRKSAKHAR